MAYDSIADLPIGQLLSVAHQEAHEALKANLEAVQGLVGVAATTPTESKLLIGTGPGTSAWSDDVDIGAGDDVRLYSIASNRVGGQRLTISKGTSASPDTSPRPLVKINRYADVPDAEFGVSGTDGGEDLAALVVANEFPASSTNQPVAVLGIAKHSGTAGGSGSRWPDATGGYFRGWTTGAGAVGRGIGLFAQGYSNSTLGRADAAQLVSSNGSGSPHSVHTTGISGSTGAWICAAGSRSGAGVQVGNGFGAQFDVGFHVNGQTSASPTATVQTASVANPTVITTTAAHGLEDGDQVVITGSNSTPSIDGTYTATVTGTTTFTIPVNVTVQGTAGSITGRIGAARTAAFRDDSNAASGLEIRGSHSTAAVNLSQAVGGNAIWIPNAGTDTTGKGRVVATNKTGTGVVTVAKYDSSGILTLGAEDQVTSTKIHYFTGGAWIPSGTIGLLATNMAGNGTRRILDYNSSGVLSIGAGAEASIYSAVYHTFAAGIYVGAGDIVTDTTTGTKIGTSTSQKLGFFNATPIVKPTGVAVSAAGIHAALVSLGLIGA